MPGVGLARLEKGSTLGRIYYLPLSMKLAPPMKLAPSAVLVKLAPQAVLVKLARANFTGRGR
jgi:hypothetical protein